MTIADISDTVAESGVIATLVCNPEFILHSEHLKAGYFFGEDNGCIYWAIQELYKSGVENIDAFNISNMLASHKGVKTKVEQYNLPSMEEYIELCSNIARNTLEEYNLLVDRVIELSFKRELHRVLVGLEKDCFSKLPLTDLSTKIYDKLNNLTEKYITNGDIKMFSNMVDELWENICSRRNPNGTYGIPSKFKVVGKYFNYEPGELVVIKGRMKQGKSAFCLNEAIHKIQNGIPTVYFDTEMSDELFFERMLANLTGVEIKSIKEGTYTSDEAKIIENTLKWIKEQPFVHIYDPYLTNEKIYATCKVLTHKIDLQFIIFDYLKSNLKDSAEQSNDLGAKTDYLKNNVAGVLNLPVLAGCQIGRGGQVADSDKIERYCTVSMSWESKTSDEYLKDGNECGNYKLSIELNRIGEQMDKGEYLDFAFDGNRMRIEQALKQHDTKIPF